MVLGDMRPYKEILKPECIAEYQAAHRDIHNRLILIGTSIDILETIVSFPLRHLLAPDEPFFDILYLNFAYSCVVVLHGLLEEGGETFGILHFKNCLARSWLPEAERRAFRSRLRTLQFSATARDIQSRMAALRDKVIAHRDREVVVGSLKIPGLTISDLRALFNETKILFDCCCFGTECGTTFYPDGTVEGRPVERDIERFMRLLLRHSRWLMQPEEDGMWPEMRERMPKADLDELNRWRVQLGLRKA